MDDSPSRTRTAVTLAVAALVFIGMGWYGVMAATKPLPTFDSADSGDRCSDAEIVRTTTIRRSEITVSVYNAGARKGFAGLTQERLERAGFRPGALGNAPDGMTFKRSVVFTSSDELAPARLVARVLGPGTRVRETEETYGPGVDVFVGSRQRTLNQKAPRKIKLDEPVETCVRVD